jgi:hypothetical protein
MRYGFRAFLRDCLIIFERLLLNRSAIPTERFAIAQLCRSDHNIATRQKLNILLKCNI